MPHLRWWGASCTCAERSTSTASPRTEVSSTRVIVLSLFFRNGEKVNEENAVTKVILECSRVDAGQYNYAPEGKDR